jgi:hypothetical protein
MLDMYTTGKIIGDPIYLGMLRESSDVFLELLF